VNEIIAKAERICWEFAQGKLAREEWAGLMNAIHYQDCSAAPTVDIDRLLKQIRYSDDALMKLAELAHRGLDAKCDCAFEK
jgi:hypothetical protein